MCDGTCKCKESSACEKEHGGRAFPGGNGPFPLQPGMTLRDYFAGQAVIALSKDLGVGKDVKGDESVWAWASMQSYAIADAMLRARER